jgi:hypothetical protein
VCGARKQGLWWQIARISPGHKSFWNFTKIVKNKCRSVPALKVNGITLITEQEHAGMIAENFSLAHDNTVQSPLSAVIEESYFVLHDDRFNVNRSALTSLKEVGKAILRCS